MESGKKLIPSLQRLIKEDVSQVLKGEQQSGMMDEERAFSRRKEQPVPGCRDLRGHGIFGE